MEGPPGPCGCGCALTPYTSYGFDLIDFARDVLGEPFDPWQEWTAIHTGELLPDGRPRFRVVLIIVARQNGKTHYARVLTLYWQYIEHVPLVLAMSNKLGYAKIQWNKVINTARRNRWLRADLGPKPVRSTIGEECFTVLHRDPETGEEIGDCEYRITAANEDAGRSLTVHRLLIDELRSHDSFDAWNASTNAMNAVLDGQVLIISNEGKDTAIVLDSVRDSAMAHIKGIGGDPRTGLFSYSAPEGSAPDDLDALAMSNPNMGRRIGADTLLSAARTAMGATDKAMLEGHMTEVMCIRVNSKRSAINLDLWANGGTVSPIDLAEHRDRVALCVDIAVEDATHATLAAAAVIDGTVHVEIIAQWDGQSCTADLRRELPGLVNKIRPRVFGWFPHGPAAAVAAALADRGTRGWPPRRVKVEAITAESTSVCMGLNDLVITAQIKHPQDPMLDQHVADAVRVPRGDAWVFGRRASGGPIDGLYAVAGAAHLARTLPPAPPPLVAV